MAICSHCGTQTEENQQFCANCGNPLADRSPQKSAAAPNSPNSRRARTVWASVLLCIFLLFSLIPVFSLLTVRNALRQETILHLMQRLDLDEIPMWQLDASFEDDKSLTLAEFLCEELNNTITRTVETDDWIQFTPRELRRCMEETTFPEFVAKQSAELLEAYLEGDTEFSIRTRDVEKVLRQNEEYLTREREIYLDEGDVSQAARQFLKGSGLDALSLPEPDAATRNILEAVDGMLEPSALLWRILVFLGLLAVLFVVNRKHLLYALRDAGLVCILGTVLPLVTTVMVRQMIGQFEGSNALLYIGSVAVSCILETTVLPCILLLVAGVVLLAVSIVLKFRKRADQTQ